MAIRFKSNTCRAIAILATSGLPERDLMNPATIFNDVLNRSRADDGEGLRPGTWMFEMGNAAYCNLRSYVKYMAKHCWGSNQAVSRRTLYREMLTASGDSFTSVMAVGYVALYQAWLGIEPQLFLRGNPDSACCGGFMAMTTEELNESTEMQQTAFNVMRNLLCRYSDDCAIENPLVGLARDDAAGTERFASTDERAAWLVEAEGVSKRLWHMGTAIHLTDLLVELFLQKDLGTGDLGLLRQLGVLYPTRRSLDLTAYMKIHKPDDQRSR